jgi:hypothetical protein
MGPPRGGGGEAGLGIFHRAREAEGGDILGAEGGKLNP